MAKNPFIELERKQKELDDTVAMVTTAAHEAKEFLSSQMSAVKDMAVQTKKHQVAIAAGLHKLSKTETEINGRCQATIDELASCKAPLFAEVMATLNIKTAEWFGAQKAAVSDVTAEARQALEKSAILLEQLKAAELHLREEYDKAVQDLASYKDTLRSELRDDLSASTESWFKEKNVFVNTMLEDIGKTLANAMQQLTSLQQSLQHVNDLSCRLAQTKRHVIVLYVLLCAVILVVTTLIVWVFYYPQKP